MATMNLEKRRKIAETTIYKWESCVGCGRSEKDYFLETGFAMLIWHTDIGAMCEYCYGEYDDEERDEDY